MPYRTGHPTRDDAAMAALIRAMRKKQEAERIPWENIGREDLERFPEQPNERYAGLYQDWRDDQWYYTDIGEAESPLGGEMDIQSQFPIAGDVHTHPNIPGSEHFSSGDFLGAVLARWPIYMAQMDEDASFGFREVRKFDPSQYDEQRTDPPELLARFPIDEFRRYLMMKLLDRHPDDERGLMR